MRIKAERERLKAAKEGTYRQSYAAAVAVGQELKSILHMAKIRGLSTAQIFEHFDRGLGYGDVDDLVEGLAKLGVGLSPSAAEILMSMIGRASSLLFRAEDLEAFAYAPDAPTLTRVAPPIVAADGSNVSITLSTMTSNSQKGLLIGSKRSKSGKSITTAKVDASHAQTVRDHATNQPPGAADMNKTSLLFPPKRPAPTQPSAGATTNIPPPSDESHNHPNGRKTSPPPSMGTAKELGMGGKELVAAISKEKQQAMMATRLMEMTSPDDSDHVIIPPSDELTTTQPLHQQQERGRFDSKPASWARSKTKNAYRHMLRQQTLRQEGGTRGVLSFNLRGGCNNKKAQQTGREAMAADDLTLEENNQDTENGGGEEGTLRSDAATARTIDDTSSQSSLSIPGLNLVGLDLPDPPRDDLDCFCHLEEGLILTYRVLRSTSRPKPRKIGAVLEKIADTIASAEAFSLMAPRLQSSFLLMMFPDLLMTLDTLSEAMAPLLDRHPNGSILLVGLPGLPNTHWPKHSRLSPDMQASCAARLLHHLYERRLWEEISPQKPFFLVGFGSGGTVALSLAAKYLPIETQRMVESVIAVGPVTCADKQLKRTVTDLQRVLLRAKHYERINLLSYLHFSDAFLREEGDRLKALSNFWSTRASTITPTASSSDNNIIDEPLTRDAPIFAKLQGILQSPDILPLIETLRVPLILMQATEDRLFAALPMEDIVEQSRRQGFGLVNSPCSALKSVQVASGAERNAVHVSWLKSGHEVLQERRVFFLKFLDKLIVQACDLKQRSSNEERLAAAPLESNVKASAPAPRPRQTTLVGDEDDEGHRLVQQQHQHQHQPPEPSPAKESNIEAAVKESMALSSAATTAEEGVGLASQPSSNVMKITQSLSGSSESPAKHKSLPSEEADASYQELPKRTAQDANLHTLRKKQQEDANRQRQVRMYREKLQKQAIKDKEKDERITMMIEEQRSRLAEAYFKECEQWEEDAVAMRTRAADMKMAREEKLMEQLEKEHQQKRVEKYEQRRNQVAETRKRVLDDLHEESDRKRVLVHDFDIHHLDLKLMTDDIMTRFKDMTKVRMTLIDSMKQHRLIEDKVRLFWARYQEADDQVRTFRRALRLLETNAALKAASPDPREIDALTHKMDKQIEMQMEFHALWKAQVDLFDLVNFKVQSCITQLAEREKVLELMLEEVQNVEDRLNESVGEVRIAKESLLIDKVQREVQLPKLIAQLAKITKTQAQLVHHTHKYVDTDIWQEGVIQRVPRLALIQRLNEEEAQLRKSIDEIETVIHAAVCRLEELEKNRKETLTLTHRVMGMREKAAQQFGEIRRLSPIDELREQVAAEERAALKTKETSIQGVDQTQMLSLGYKVRHTPSAERTKDEKRWVSMDVLINPGLYKHVTELEAEAMKFDEEYEITLDREEVQRLLKLPSEVQLALPFLHNPDQLYAHKILNHYSKEKGEEYYKARDLASQDGSDKGMSTTGAGHEMDEAESRAFLELLMKERNSSLARAKLPLDRTKEEKDFITMDRIMRAAFYDEIDRIAAAKEEEERRKRGRRLVTDSLEDAEKREQLGGQYEAARKRYVNDLKHPPDWKCTLTAQELEAVYQVIPRDLEHCTEQHRYCRELMDKYYVPDEDTKIGRRLINLILALEGVMAEAIKVDLDDDDHSSTALVAQQTSKPERVFGSWKITHPAGGGLHSQQTSFQKNSLAHPASFAVTRKSTSPSSSPSRRRSNRPSRPSITSSTTHSRTHNISEKGYVIVRSLENLANLAGEKQAEDIKALLALPDQKTLLMEEGLMLEARQSRSHEFRVDPGRDVYAIDVTVTIVFQGTFGVRGYRLARMAAMLYRPQESSNKANDPSLKDIPLPVGYAPQELQSLNTPDSMGKLVIHHSPQKGPINPGAFKVVVGAASTTKYSIHVSCRLAEDANAALDRAITRTKQLQAELPKFQIELDELMLSLRLAERKLCVANQILDEADVENARISEGIGACNQKLADDDETLEMEEDEREAIAREIQALEQEFGYWCKVFSGRMQERKYVLEGIEFLRETRLNRVLEKEKTEQELERLQKYVPSAIFTVRGPKAAVDVSLELNLSLNSSDAIKKWGKSSNASAHNDSKPSALLLTPAEEIRHRHEVQGFNALLLDEQQWTMLDRSMHPELYTWLESKREERYPLAVEQFRYKAAELERIIKTPFANLERIEVHIRKLLSRFHDNPKLLQMKDELTLETGNGKETPQAFDPNAGPRARNRTAQARTTEEREWCTIDRLLNPDLYKLMKLEKHSKRMDLIELKEVEEEEENEVPLMGGRRKKKRKSKPEVEWSCPFDRNDILRIWSVENLDDLSTEDEKHTALLLRKLSGPYQAYLQYEHAQVARQALTAAAAASAMQSNHGSGGAGKHIDFNKMGRVITTDVDDRCRIVLREIDSVTNNSNEFTTSCVLHTADQKFPTKVLRVELERELDRLLREQMMERERLCNSLDEAGGAATKIEENENKNFKAGIPGQLPEQDDEGGQMDDQIMKTRAEERKKNRAAHKEEDEHAAVLAARKRIQMANKTAAELELAKELDALGPTGCLACMNSQCTWVTNVDRKAVQLRIEAINDEINFVRDNPMQNVIESVVPLSAQRGGATKFRREDIMAELKWEVQELNKRLKLDALDKEYHEACATRKEYVEVETLHGYRTVLWTGNAKRALAAAHDRIVANVVAVDIIDDILEWMLEGWVFGERKSQFTVAGFVPSIRPDGPIRTGKEQLRSAATIQLRAEEKKKLQGEGHVFPEDEQGTPFEKLQPIEMDRKYNINNELVVKEGSDRQHILNETENQLRFGLFMLTFMYFRSMVLLKREKESWSGGTHDAMRGDHSHALVRNTTERQKMLMEQKNAEKRQTRIDRAMKKAATGEERRRLREEQEKEERAQEFYERVRREKMEVVSTLAIQRVFRGHIGRKAARRWCMKRAELDAMSALLTASCINIQRTFRGYLGRMRATEMRMEMTEFINRMRTVDALEDEEDYWNTHPWEKFKKDVRELFQGDKERKMKKAMQTKLPSEEEDKDHEDD